MNGPKRLNFAFLFTICLAIGFGQAGVACAGKISEIKISPDLRRVVVKCDGSIGEQISTSVKQSSNLVIDIAGASVGSVEPLTRAGQGAGLTVEVSRTQSGARLFLNFGGVAVPEHKIRPVGDYLMIFLGEWTPKPIDSVNKISEKATLARPAPLQRQKDNLPVKFGADSPLIIKSIEVVDGVIVLQVANRTNPAGKYRIELGINFDHLGFSLANIQSLKDFQKPSAFSEVGEKLWSKAAVSGVKMGPRKTPAAYFVQRSDYRDNSSFRIGGQEKNTGTVSPLTRLRRQYHSPFAASHRSHEARIQRPIFPQVNTAMTLRRSEPHRWTKSVFPQVMACTFDPAQPH
ncbi:MAG TPA: hypothetical protein VMC85_04775 [Desulfomonilaceae bacterium]|nr:hypothetical protein [Desulfomonilaceae bacterium]